MASGGRAPARQIGAVIVNHNAGPALVACVTSIRAAGAQPIVVDNASSDRSLEGLRTALPDVEVFAAGTNLGYGAAVNAGASLIGGDYLLVSNPDIVIEPDAIARLGAVLDLEGDIAVVGPRLLYPDGGLYPSARSFPSFSTAAAHAFVGLFWPGNPWSRRYRLEGDDAVPGSGPEAARDVDWVSGACFLARRAAFDAVGGFDEGYFMYVEDLDLCWRLGRAGWRVRFEPQAVVVHDQGLSARRRPYRMIIAHHLSTWRFARRSAAGPDVLLLPLVAAGLSARLVLSLLKEAFGSPSSRPLDR